MQIYFLSCLHLFFLQFQMTDFLQVIVLVLCIQCVSNFELNDKSPCFGKNATSEPVIRFCDEIGGTLVFRCCRAPTNTTFVAIDFMDANLTDIPIFRDHSNFNLSVVDLRENSDLQSSIDDDAFLTMIYLEELLLPKQVPCPGGRNMWQTINETIEPEGYYCINQISICVNSTDFCPEKGSMCDSNGPSHYVCQCQPDYHGYKCLRHGDFPSGIFLGTCTAVTIVASILFFWTHRRHVKKVNHNKQI